MKKKKIWDIPELRQKEGVFAHREEAGRVLASLLKNYRGTDSVVLAIPAGGVPVAAVIAEELGLPLDVAVVSKITFPWTTEAGYGAVAFDGTVILNEEMLDYYRLSPDIVEEGKKNTLAKVIRRLKELRGNRPFPQLKGKTVILVDDGLASGITMLAAVKAVKKLGAERIVVAVPTAHWESLEKILPHVEEIYCPNLRAGWHFAVADAYRIWYDVSEEEAKEILSRFNF